MRKDIAVVLLPQEVGYEIGDSTRKLLKKSELLGLLTVIK